MTLPPLLAWDKIHQRLSTIFPQGAPNREHSVWEISARTIFVILYAGAVEGSSLWLRPDQVTRMTDKQASRTGDDARLKWAKISVAPSKKAVAGRWYAANTRESIRDDTIRYSLIPNGAVVEKPGLATTSPAGRYALQAEFAALLDPTLDRESFQARADAWRAQHLNAGALARIAIMRKSAAVSDDQVLVTFPNGETRFMKPGPSTGIVKAVIEIFTAKFLQRPSVIFLSESGNKIVARDDDLAKAMGLNIASDKTLPDVVLADLGPRHPLLVFVEVVATDGPMNESRKNALLQLTEAARFPREHVAFVTAYLDRDVQPFRRTVASVAWGTYAWFAGEPDRLLVFSEEKRPLGDFGCPK